MATDLASVKREVVEQASYMGGGDGIWNVMRTNINNVRQRKETNVGFAKIKGKLTSRIGAPVRFGTPKDVGAKGGTPGFGRIVDEVWATPERNTSPERKPENKDDWGDYSLCAQLIKWGENNHSIRLAYYRRRAGEDWWEFAAQMTVNSDWRTIKALLERTLAKTGWFSDSPIIQ